MPAKNTGRPTTNLVVGVISDTHGRMHAGAVDALRGSDVILHAGDIGSMDVIRKLEAIAPVHAIVGNVDIGPLTGKFPATDVVEIAGFSFYLIHSLRALDLKPEAAGFAAVISGHSHKPDYEFKNGVLYFNPGSAGPKRFSLPITVGKIVIRDGELWPEVVELE